MYNCNLSNWPPEVILITVFIRTVSSCLVFLCDVSTLNILDTEFIQYVHAANFPFSFSFIYGFFFFLYIYIYSFYRCFYFMHLFLLLSGLVFTGIWFNFGILEKASYLINMLCLLMAICFCLYFAGGNITPTYTCGTYRTEWHSSCG